jgi:hypothetical protein
LSDEAPVARYLHPARWRLSQAACRADLHNLNCRSRAKVKNEVKTITYASRCRPESGQKAPFRALHPAKNSLPGGAGKYLLTIPA